MQRPKQKHQSINIFLDSRGLLMETARVSERTTRPEEGGRRDGMRRPVLAGCVKLLGALDKVQRKERYEKEYHG